MYDRVKKNENYKDKLQKKTQIEPNITKTLHLIYINKIPPDAIEPLDSSSDTSIAAGISTLSVSIHNGNPKKICNKTQIKNNKL